MCCAATTRCSNGCAAARCGRCSTPWPPELARGVRARLCGSGCARAYPRRDDGQTLLPFRRIFLVARGVIEGGQDGYWLMKSEPTAYSWEQLVKDKRTNWSGVRNYQAANNLKAMKIGDRAFFYHSNEGLDDRRHRRDRQGGLSRSRATRPANSCMVDVEPVMPVKKPVTLAAIKAEPKLKEFEAGAAGPALGRAGRRTRNGRTIYQDGRRQGVSRRAPAAGRTRWRKARAAASASARHRAVAVFVIRWQRRAARLSSIPARISARRSTGCPTGSSTATASTCCAARMARCSGRKTGFACAAPARSLARARRSQAATCTG